MKANWVLCLVAAVAGGVVSLLANQIVRAQGLKGSAEVRAQEFILVDNNDQTQLIIRSGHVGDKETVEIFDSEGRLVWSPGPPSAHPLSFR